MSCTLPVRGTLACLAFSAAIPLFVGQLLRVVPCPACVARVAPLLPRAALLLVIFTSFCEMFLQTELTVSAHEVLTTLLIGRYSLYHLDSTYLDVTYRPAYLVFFIYL